jgi:phage replication O-like protein O
MTGEEIQVENGGYTRIHNAILETLAMAKLAPLEFNILFLLLRKTYGFQKKMDLISLSQFEECGGSRTCTVEAIQNLLRLNVIIRIPHGQGFEYGFNKYIEEWLPETFETRHAGRGENFHPSKPVGTTLYEETGKPVGTSASKPVDGTSKPVGTKTSKPVETHKRKKENIQKKEKKEIVFSSIPDSLNTPGFVEEWDKWLAYRKEIKHTVTPTTQVSQLKSLSGFAPTIAIAMLEQSIRQGWRGIFPLKDDNKPTTIQPPTRTYIDVRGNPIEVR